MNPTSKLSERAKLLGFTSVKSYKKACAPNFNCEEVLHDHKHTQVSSQIDYQGYYIELKTDEKIHELVRLLNKIYPTTNMSCQCDYFGYANISFTLNGFQIFTNMLLETAKKRQKILNPNLSENQILDLVYELSIIQRFVFDSSEKQSSRTNKLTFKSNICDGENKWSQIIIWQFLTTDIEDICKELNDIFSYY